MNLSLRHVASPRALASLALLPLLAGCWGDPTGNGSLRIEVSGRLERGQAVTFAVLRGADTLAPSRVQLTFSPAEAVQAVSGDGYRLAAKGSVTVTAAAPGLRGRRELEVAAPPMVVFDRQQGGTRDVWKVALDGGDLEQLTNHAAEDLDPTVGGGTVVFVSYRSGNADLWSVPLAGGEVRRLTTTVSAELSPALSPDGSRLAYTNDASGVSKLWVAGGDGTGAARATTGFGFAGSIEAGPAWAPGGSRLVFVSTSSGKADLYQMTPPAAPTMFLGSQNAAEVEPAWSHDGTRVAFTSDNTPDGDTEVFVMRVSDGALTRLTRRAGTDSHPTWTADGRLVYAEIAGGVSRLRWMDPAVPEVSYPIDTGPGSAARPFAVP